MRSCSELIKKPLKNRLMTAQKVVRPGVETTFIRSESRSEGDYYTKDFSCLRCACAVCCLGCLHVSYNFVPASYALSTHISIQIKGSFWEIQPPSLAAPSNFSPRSCFITAISGPNHGGKHLWTAGCEIRHVASQLKRVKTSHRNWLVGGCG